MTSMLTDEPYARLYFFRCPLCQTGGAIIAIARIRLRRTSHAMRWPAGKIIILAGRYLKLAAVSNPDHNRSDSILHHHRTKILDLSQNWRKIIGAIWQTARQTHDTLGLPTVRPGQTAVLQN